MYYADISGQYLFQSLDCGIHYHYHTTTTVPNYNVLHTSEASYQQREREGRGRERERGKSASLLYRCNSTNAFILPTRKIKLRHKLSNLKCVELWTTSKDRVFSYKERSHTDMLNKMHLIPADLILHFWTTINSNSLSIIILSTHLTLFSLLPTHIINPTNKCMNSSERVIKNINLQKTIALAIETLLAAACHRVVFLN